MIVLILVNSVDPDEMPPYVAFYQGLHCLPKLLFAGGVQNEKFKRPFKGHTHLMGQIRYTVPEESQLNRK